MTRVLSVSRVTVLPEFEAEYINTIRALAEIGMGRGQHLWLFKSSDTAHTYLEFSESRTEMSHRSRASRTDIEMRLERRLSVIAQYSAASRELWEEVEPPEPREPRTSSGWDPESENEDEGL
jgi:hypothetical protein